MKKILFFGLFGFLLWIDPMWSQQMLGLHTDNYAGVYSLHYNPAETVDSRYKFHMNLFSFNGDVSSDYLGLKREFLFEGDKNLFSVNDIASLFSPSSGLSVQKKDYDKRSIYLSGDISVLPSMMYTFGVLNNQSIAFSFRTRFQAKTEGVMSDLMLGAYNREISSVIDGNSKDYPSAFQFNIWNEYALTYGRTIGKTGFNNIAAAVTLKVTQGVAGAYANFKNDGAFFEVNDVVNSESNIVIDDEVDFGFSKLLSTGIGNAAITDLFVSNDIGAGIDIGGTWEYRPRVDEFFYELDNNPYNFNPEIEKYKFKVGLSLMDIGIMPYSTYQNNNTSYRINVNTKLDYLLPEINRTLRESNSLVGLNNIFDSVSRSKTEKKNSFTAFLPMHANAYFDYYVLPKFYANASITYYPNIGDSSYINGLSQIVITPRYETKKFSAYLPVSADLDKNINVGLGFRAGFFVMGFRDILPLVYAKQEVFGSGFYVGASIPIFRKLGDMDGDHISDRLDECKDRPGTEEKKGCPTDTDGDGVEDDKDSCPEISGRKQFEGCLDTDGDRVGDNIDLCIDVPGKEELDGCPDSDRDDISDPKDKCPFDKGSEEFKGCPDTDKDGIGDNDDICPETFGKAKFRGCKDTDRDGVGDNEDECIALIGKKKFKGCPDNDNDGIADTKDIVLFAKKELLEFTKLRDTDKDGIPDAKDNCVTEKGSFEQMGCPKKTGEHFQEESSDKFKEDMINEDNTSQETINKDKSQEKSDDTQGVVSDTIQKNKKILEATRREYRQMDARAAKIRAEISAAKQIKIDVKAIPELSKRLTNNLSRTMHFDPDRYTLDPSVSSNLDSVVGFLNINPDYILNVGVHTDSVGSSNENMELSQRRANFIKMILIMKGVPPSRVVVQSYGESRPIASNKTLEGRAKNRRVDFNLKKIK